MYAQVLGDVIVERGGRTHRACERERPELTRPADFHLPCPRLQSMRALTPSHAKAMVSFVLPSGVRPLVTPQPLGAMFFGWTTMPLTRDERTAVPSSGR